MTATMDHAKAEAFAGQMIGMFNSANLALMMSVADRTGLFDTMAEMEPATSEEIAKKAGLNERYVREWLAAMTVGRIVEHDPEKATYQLPAEHAASLTKAAGPGNVAGFMRFLGMMGEVEDGIVDAFRNGGGVPYSQFRNFTALMANMSSSVYDLTLIEGTLPLVDGLVDRLRAGIEVADVGCGSGHALNLMAGAFPNSRFVGFDFSEEAITAARKQAADKGLTNATFEVRDAAQLGEKQRFDLITVFDAIHDQAKPDVVLKAIYEAMKPDGVFLCVDIAASSHVHENMDHPLAPFLYSVSTFHCMTVSLALGGMGLGTAWGEQKAVEMLGEAGFKDVDVKKVDGDIFNNYYIAKP